MTEFSKEGRKLRPRKSAAVSAPKSERVEYSRPARQEGEGRKYGERRSYGDRPSGEGRRSYGSRPDGGERRTYGSRPANGEGRRSYGDRPEGGERRTYGSRPTNGERKAYGSRPDSEGRTFGRSAGSRGRSFGDRPSNGERKSFQDRPAFGERKSFSRDGRPSFKGRKPAGRRGEAFFTRESEEGIGRMISRRPQVDDTSRYSDFDNAPTLAKDEIRLNKFIANSGVCSRREADTLIQAGVVTVNGVVVTELGTKINIFNDDIRFNGERLKGEEKVYLVMNKPKGYVTTASDPHAEKTVMELLKGCEYRVFPVGRLDKNTTGVLMFTNDGEIAERLTHPSYDKKKIYQVIINRDLEKDDYEKILLGVELTDGVVAADELEYIDEGDHRKLGIEIHSGKNRVVRRIFESLGYDVRALDRVYFAGLTKKGLKKGEWRQLSETEVNILKMGAYV